VPALHVAKPIVATPLVDAYGREFEASMKSQP
jgi:hypothetical protein